VGPQKKENETKKQAGDVFSRKFGEIRSFMNKTSRVEVFLQNLVKFRSFMEKKPYEFKKSNIP
jgi:hypothetical protein